MTKDQELKKEFINKLEDMFEGAYQLDPGKTLVIPYEGVELKLSFTVKKGGGSVSKKLEGAIGSNKAPLQAPSDLEMEELKKFLEEL